MQQITLHAVSKEAKDIWVETLNAAIVACTKAQAEMVLPVGNISKIGYGYLVWLSLLSVDSTLHC